MTWLLAVALAAAPTPDGERGYEERLVDWALQKSGRELEPSPEGLRIEEVLVLAEDVFSPSDPYPGFLNVFHWRTRDAVLRREVLLAEGEPWSQARALETERNLRRLFFLAVSKVVPVKGRAGGVALVVATKDKWSLRLSNAFTLIGSILQYLQLSLTEANFNGYGQSLSVGMTLRLDTLSFSQTFVERRLFGSRLYLGETAAIVLNRVTGLPEGTSGQVVFALPLLSLDQPWGFDFDTTWNVRRRRVFRGATIWQLPYPDEASTQTVPLVYDVRELNSQLSGTRSFGRELKLDVTAALGGYLHQYTPPKDSGLDVDQAQWLVKQWLPRSENVTYAAAYLRAFPADFRVLHDLDTFELSEDFQLGWLAQAGVRWAFPLPFAPSSFVEVGASLRYRFYAQDDLFTVTVAGGARFRPGSTTVNERVAAEVINYSPRVFGGRVVARVLTDLKWNDLDNRQQLLGGSTGLRGTFGEQFSGRNLLLANVEFRAKPFEVLTSWLGLVFFYDAGSAFDVTPVLTHTVGIGLRLLLPQLNSEVIRLDFGVVIGGPPPGIDRLNASWGQVTDIRPAFLDQPY
jgi:hypothetical protein